LFQTSLKQFDALRKRNAFIDNYRQFKMFRDGFEEFDHAKFGFFVDSFLFLIGKPDRWLFSRCLSGRL
jgi:hypothetical protein